MASEKTATSDEKDVSAILDQINTAFQRGKDEDMDLVFTQLLHRLIAKNPQSAACLAESLKVGRWRVEMLRRVTQQWTNQDPVKAWEWAEQLPNPDERNSALTDACFQIAEVDPKQAVELADKCGLSNLNGTMFDILVQRWAEQDFDAAVDWAEKLPTSEQRNQILARVAMVLAETSPNEAAQFVSSAIPGGTTQSEAAMTVLHQWAKSDLSAARNWVIQFPAGTLRDRALNELKVVESYNGDDDLKQSPSNVP